MRSSKNIILTLKNITAYFTGKEKIITLVSIITMLSFANIINTSALSYQTETNINFTFNPTLSINISHSDLVIDNLAPGTTGDSNTINVSVATNAAYGYTLSAIMNGNNNNLTHTNGTNIFSSIATDASLSSLTTDNTWGYSYKLSNDTNWNNYSGLSTETSKTLVDSNDQTAIPIDFKIGAKASSTQPSGTYTGTINFTAVTKPTPITLADAYASEGKTMVNGFYTMQDMTSTICSKVEAIGAQLQALDKRDNKLYWIAKLADNHCWMTQNLDLDLDSNRTYTHWDTDLGWSNSSNLDVNATWKPNNSTMDFTIGSTIPGWQSSSTEPYSANPGDVCFYTSNSDSSDTQYDSLQECIDAGHNDCTHYHAGNYYNWSASVASNDTSELTTQYDNAPNSICPKAWKIPQNNPTNDFSGLFRSYNITPSYSTTPSIAIKLRLEPIWLILSGDVSDGELARQNQRGGYWTSTVYNSQGTQRPIFGNTQIIVSDYGWRYHGFPLRCLAR